MKIKKNFTFSLTAFLSLLMGFGVICSGAHSKEVVAYANASQGIFLASFKKQAADDSATPTKVAAELHNHIEKQTLKSIVKQVGDQSPQSDIRSLKRVRPVSRKHLHQRQPHWWPLHLLGFLAHRA